jgi:hypothetical protein
MTIYSLTEKGKKNIGSCGGHSDRILRALASGPKESKDLYKVVSRHTESDAPVTILSWYLSQLSRLSYISRKVETKEAK